MLHRIRTIANSLQANEVMQSKARHLHMKLYFHMNINILEDLLQHNIRIEIHKYKYKQAFGI